MSKTSNLQPRSSNLPDGTVTFLFTDIEGSTQLLHKLKEGYTGLLAEHHNLLRVAFANWGGHEIDTQGDSFFVSFPRATDAVRCVVEAQRALAAHQWPEGVEVRVRMGLHTGEPWQAVEGYVGVDVHRAARIAHTGHGGQVLLSETTTALVIDELPQGVELRDLGRHVFKDMKRPERIHQLVIKDLPSDFPALKSLEHLPDERPKPAPVRLPSFLESDAVEGQLPVFVARQAEIGRLYAALEKALQGHGSLFFISGGPGRGKTALMDAFSRMASAAHPALLVASGNCNAFTGTGDPYLPFRDILAMLSGDVEAKWKTGTIGKEQAVRLWKSLPLLARTILDCGIDLLNVFIPITDLAARARAATPGEHELHRRLAELVKVEHSSPGELGQRALFEQYIELLERINQEHPLLLLIDDLQWADNGSISLLFHLGRRLAGSRILLLGAYRPEEVALGRAGDRHPLETPLAEFKRQYGDITIDLSHADQLTGRQFVDEFLSCEPNRLPASFGQALFDHTGGHPLFTVELLRDLQERGILLHDPDGYWILASPLDWNELPARVEGVIEARISRLEEELRETLSVASVEGEEFTAQVVAMVQELSERKILHHLSTQLENRHRLVKTGVEKKVGDNILSNYRFAHSLFQKFLYDDISPGERRLLHKQIALELEVLYAPDQASISPQLARHYSQASEGAKAAYYLLIAGDKVRNMYALQDAIRFYQRALDFLKDISDYESSARTLMKLGLAHHLALEYDLANQSYQEGFRLWGQTNLSVHVEHLPPTPHPLRVAQMADPHTLNPGLVSDAYASSIVESLFTGLLAQTPEMDVVPSIANSWELHDGGCKYVFHLRQDACWSDGSPVTAEDFIISWVKLLDPVQDSMIAGLFYDIRGAKAFHQGETSAPDKLGIRALNSHTLVVELEAPTGYFLQLLALPNFYPIPKHVAERYGQDWASPDHIIGNGPFLLERWEHGKGLTLVQNPRFFGLRRGNLEKVDIKIIPPKDWETSLTLYDSEELDILDVTYLTVDMKQLAKLYTGEYISTPELATYYLVFNQRRAPFDDIRVRRAFMMALDSEKRANPVTTGASLPALGGLIPPGMAGHSPGIGLPYDPEGARWLLAEAGYPGGKDFPVVDFLLWHGAETQLESTRKQWQENLGVDINWTFVPFSQIALARETDEHHIYLSAWVADYPDPDNFLRVGLRKYLTGWSGEDYDRIVDEARHLLDTRERIKCYQAAERILIEEGVILPLVYGLQHFLVKPWVKNYLLSPQARTFWKDVIIEPH